MELKMGADLNEIAHNYTEYFCTIAVISLIELLTLYMFNLLTLDRECVWQ